jgi:hypothetical protein
MNDRGGAGDPLEPREDEERRTGHQFGHDDRLRDLAGVMHGEVTGHAVTKAKHGESQQRIHEGDEAKDECGLHPVVGEDIGFPY